VKNASRQSGIVAIPPELRGGGCARPLRLSTKVFLRPVDSLFVMPNLYFCQPHAQNQGMLRAVLSLADCCQLLAAGSATYLGQEFPNICGRTDSADDFAVLSIGVDESSADWKPGYYRVNVDLMELNAQLLTLTH
jgi:hypothetical protein